MLKPSSHQSKKQFLNMVHIIHIGRNIHIILNLYCYLLRFASNMMTLCKVLMRYIFRKMKLHGALEFYVHILIILFNFKTSSRMCLCRYPYLNTPLQIKQIERMNDLLHWNEGYILIGYDIYHQITLRT